MNAQSGLCPCVGMVDILVLETSAERRVSSSLTGGTKFEDKAGDGPTFEHSHLNGVMPDQPILESSMISCELVQLVERRTLNPNVDGSSPSLAAKFAKSDRHAEHRR